MGINLQKGQKINLTKEEAPLSRLIVGLGWDTNKYSGSYAFDLDASAFLLGENGKVNSDTDFIFYSNLSHNSGAVIHMGDNRTGEGDGDDEQIELHLSKMPDNIHKIAITVTIYDEVTRAQNFGQVSNAYIHVMDGDSGEDLLRYDLGEDFSVETALVVGEIYRNAGNWKFSAVGAGFSGGLRALCENFGLEVE